MKLLEPADRFQKLGGLQPGASRGDMVEHVDAVPSVLLPFPNPVDLPLDPPQALRMS
jgi:hypothetical protein